MDKMGKEYRNILNNLEERLKDNPDLEYVKSEFTNLFMLFFNEVDSLRELYEEKILTILDRQSYFDEKISTIEEKTKELEKEILYNEEDDQMIRNLLNSSNKNIDEYEEQECEVCCPYCGEIFFIDLEEVRDEVSCPYCNKVIELDWNDTFDENTNKKDEDNEDM